MSPVLSRSFATTSALRAPTLPSHLANAVFATAMALCSGACLQAQCAPQWATPYPYGGGVNGTVDAVVTMPNGDLIVGGSFTSAGGVSATGIARWNGTSWSNMGATLAALLGVAPHVWALAVRPNGNLVIAGTFDTLGGVSMRNIAQWDGATWSPLAGGLWNVGQAAVSSLLQMPNGDLLASGNFTYSTFPSPTPYLATWNGVSWSTTSAAWLKPALTMARLLSGNLVLGTQGGPFDYPQVAIFSGSGWSDLGGPILPMGNSSAVNALAVLPNGDLIAGGSFTSVAGVAASNVVRWNGSICFPLGSGTNGAIRAMTVLPNGDLIVGGSFSVAGGVSASRLARWNGTNWSAVGATLSGSSVNALGMTSNGDLVVGGQFTAAGGASAPGVTRLTSTCPANASTVGTGCIGSGGLNVLTATTLPWIGSTFQARATGMPAYAFALAATGFSTLNVALPTLLPQGQAGCSLLVSPDVVDVLLPQAGVANSQLALPNTPALVGQSFHQQVLPLEVDFALNALALTSTNALAMTIGAF